MADDHLRGLNAKQRSAVAYGISSGNTKSGPLLILAGAGTGKTRTLAARVAHLLTHNADPHKLLILSFGRQAARDIGRRAKQASRSVRPEVRLAWVGTFHYAAARLLRRYASHVGLSSSFTIIDKIDAEAVMELARSHVIASVQRSRVPDKRVCLQILARKVARAESLKQTLRHFPKWQEFRPTIHRVLKTFAAIKQMRNVVDFDDLLVFWRELLKMEIVGLEIRKRFTHVLVDEYQDTNRLQAEIIRLLKPDGVGVTVVGDRKGRGQANV